MAAASLEIAGTETLLT